MGESRLVAWDHPATLPMPGPAAEPPTGRDRMLWEAMLAAFPEMLRCEDDKNEAARRSRLAANALVREWEAQCRPSN
jgi:hypothetical protein